MQAGQRKYLNLKLKANSTSIFVFGTWKMPSSNNAYKASGG